MDFFFSVFSSGGNMPYRRASSNLLNFLINVINTVCSQAKCGGLTNCGKLIACSQMNRAL